jgi:uncharacterized Zn finger protein (UPF0148 family)
MRCPDCGEHLEMINGVPVCPNCDLSDDMNKTMEDDKWSQGDRK